MKRPRECAKNLASVLKTQSKKPVPISLELDDPVAVLVMSLLMWESTTAKATAAYKRIVDRAVDFNDLRVSMPHEIVEFIGPRYPLALQRCQRLRAVLRHIFHREHDVSLQRLYGLGKREIRQYLRSLDGIVPYAGDRVMLLCFDTHCIPVDGRLHRALVKVGACNDTVDIDELASWLARRVNAADAIATHRTLQAWVDRVGENPPASRATSSGGGFRAKSAKASRPASGRKGARTQAG